MSAYPQRAPQFEPLLVHTGQHYDPNMSKLFFDQLQLPPPDVYLGVGSGSHAEQTAKVMLEMEKLLLAQAPHLVVVVGDVNSTMATAIVAAKLRLPLVHVEAGLRSGDRTMPEEINRVITDQLSDFCFTASIDADENLRREGVAPERSHFVGNVMIDTLLRLRDLAMAPVRQQFQLGARFGLVTLHRPSNVDVQQTCAEILTALEIMLRDLPLVFPVHPRTAHQLKQFGFWERLRSWPHLKLVEPLGYLDALNLLAGATLVLTDSGGIQEETTALGVPCLTIRQNTERPVTVTEGTNTLVGTNQTHIVAAAELVLAGRGKQGRIPKYWDGQAAQRIVDCLANHLPVNAELKC